MISDRTRDQYHQRGYGTSVGPGHTPAIIVVDFQRSLTEYDKFPLAWNYDREVEATAQLLRAARQTQCPVILTAIGYAPGGVDGGVVIKKIPGLVDFEVGSEWVEIDPRIRPLEGDYVLVKRVQSAFFGTMLHTFLTVRQVDTLIVTGCTTSGCVRATVTDACSWGYRVILIPECIGDQAPEPHAQNLFDMQAKNGDLMPLDEALAYLGKLQDPSIAVGTLSAIADSNRAESRITT
jgi:maleamate amidohydrolase